MFGFVSYRYTEEKTKSRLPANQLKALEPSRAYDEEKKGKRKNVLFYFFIFCRVGSVVQVRVVMDELYHLNDYGGLKLLYITPEKFCRRYGYGLCVFVTAALVLTRFLLNTFSCNIYLQYLEKL